MNINEELQGGGLWSFILKFWPLKEQKFLEENNQLHLNGYTNMIFLKNLRNSFFVTLNKNVMDSEYFEEDDDLPILIFFTGMGKTIKIIHKLFENLLFCDNFAFFQEIYSLNQMNIQCLNECVKEAIQLYEYVRKKYPSKNILLVGHSLGSGVVSQILKYLSKKEKDHHLLGALLLNTAPNITFAIKPYYFLRGIVKFIANLFLVNILDTEKALKETKYPVKIIHTRGDKMFLLKIAETLRNITSKFTKRTPFFDVQEGSHGNFVDISNEENICKELNVFVKQIKNL